MALIEFRSVYFSYNNKEYVLEGVDLSIPEYGITSIVSSPGKGKTTMLKLIKGILRPNRGSIIVLGINTSIAGKKDLMKLHTRVSIHFQDTFLISNIDTFNNIALPLIYNTNMSQKEIEYEVDKVLDLFDLRYLKYEIPFNLSPTEAKLISLARAFLMSPRIILLDEPFSLLDSYYKTRLLEVMNDFKNVSKIIFTTSEDFFTQNSELIVYILNIEDSRKVYLVER